MINIEIDGQTIEVEAGSTIIEAADKIGVTIPRFCYHKKLTIAANCRMCLVEVEKSGKPLPACATPVSDGMVIYTQTAKAKQAQKAVMEFLLINHPLDCPICDQGGECELQDVALQYGDSISRFTEGKRSVEDKDIGPLISTGMTRCIHCTRCVRFGDEIAGQREMGATGRGECMQIGTYIEKSVESELSGNIIDLCPVGALTSKPFRYKARTWELIARPGISAHDCLGSNLYYQGQHGNIKRTSPRENENLNEVWLSDKDRFAYLGFASEDRLHQPKIKKDGQWETVSFEEAFDYLGENLKRIIREKGPSHLGGLISTQSTLEEQYLFQKMLRSLGCANIDHRVWEQDFSNEEKSGSYPRFELSLAELQTQEAIVIIGSNVRKEVPLINHRIRQATLQGAKVICINPMDFDFNFDIALNAEAKHGEFSTTLKDWFEGRLESVDSTLKGLERIAFVTGHHLNVHPQADALRYFVQELAKKHKAKLCPITHGANTPGAHITGCLPFRGPFGETVSSEKGLNAQEMLTKGLDAFVLMNLEPDLDSLNPSEAVANLAKAFTVCISSYQSDAMEQYADVILPLACPSESSGTYVNILGDWQSFTGANSSQSEARPGWKILRVLGNIFELPGFEYTNTKEVKSEIAASFANATYQPSCYTAIELKSNNSKGLLRIAPMPLYSSDPVVRRATALQETSEAKSSKFVQMNPIDMKEMGIDASQGIRLDTIGESSEQLFEIAANEKVPQGSISLALATHGTIELGAPFSKVNVHAAKKDKG